VYFLECNPLPGLTPGWSDLVLIAKAAGIGYDGLINEILSGAIRRYKERERERRSEGARAPVAPINGNGNGNGSGLPAPGAPASAAPPLSEPPLPSEGRN
jgi:D-alanine-D-alanine ligase